LARAAKFHRHGHQHLSQGNDTSVGVNLAEMGTESEQKAVFRVPKRLQFYSRVAPHAFAAEASVGFTRQEA
jgi:hypothetical protein